MQPISLEASTVLAMTSRNGAPWSTIRSSRGLPPRRRRSQAMLHSYRRATSTAALIRPLASSSAQDTSLLQSHASENALFSPVCARHTCISAQTYSSGCGASSRRDNGNGLTGAEAFAKWMVDPTTHLWDTEQPWNYTTGCGAFNTPGPEKRGMNEDDTLKK